MKRTYYATSLIALITALALSFAAVATPKPESSLNQYQGLTRQDAKFFDEVYARDNADFSTFTKVFIEPTTIEFDKRWERDFRSNLSPNYRPYVVKTYPQLMEEQLKKAFSESEKYQVVESKSEAQLVLAPRITELYINGPEFSNLQNTFVNTVGRGTLQITVNNHEGQTLAKLVDNRETRNFGIVGRLRQANRARNYRDFKFLMKRWSSETVEYLQ